MEGLRRQALCDFHKAKFAPALADHELITSQASHAGLAIQRRQLPLPEILELLEENQNPQCIPTLRLVTLHIIHPLASETWAPPTLNAARDDILQLWKLFNLDPTALHLLCHGIRGLNQFPPDPVDPAADVLHFMFSSYTYCVIWAFSPKTQTTSGVIVTRPDTSAKTAHVDHWWQALQSQAAIARHPLCLFLVSAMEAVERTFRGTMLCQGRINHLERLTGFNPWNLGLSRLTELESVPMSLEELSLSSRGMGAVMVSLEDFSRQARLLRQATEHATRLGIIDLVPESSVIADVTSAINLLQQQMASWEVRIDYLRERAKNQLTVIFNLMTRYDASSSIAIAKSAKKDSTSMKAIAIMTMVFLPGTFFAALFAVPSLQWGASPVIQSNHWVYWAFAVPSTLLVMAVWLWMSREELTATEVEKRPRKDRTPMETPQLEKKREFLRHRSPFELVAAVRKRALQNGAKAVGGTDVQV